jgi:hypothetical protein
MISWVTRLLNKKARAQHMHDKIVDTYTAVAQMIGFAWVDCGSDSTLVHVCGQDYDLDDPELFHLLDELEEAYAGLGYRIIPFQDWIDHGGWNAPIDHLWLVERDEGERPQYTKHTERPERPQLHPLWKTYAT